MEEVELHYRTYLQAYVEAAGGGRLDSLMVLRETTDAERVVIATMRSRHAIWAFMRRCSTSTESAALSDVVSREAIVGSSCGDSER